MYFDSPSPERGVEVEREIMGYTSRAKRRENLRARLDAGQATMYRICGVPGCGKPTTAATGKGLNRRYCRPHEEFHARHGSRFHRTYTSAQLRPHLRAALRWLKGSRESPNVRLAVAAVETLYTAAGPFIPANGLAHMAPAARARAAWARWRHAKVKPERILAAWMAVEAAIKADSQRDDRAEFRRVQAAKAAHRLASGYHRRWETTFNGRPLITELHKWPQSRGRVLRILGEQLERAAEPLALPAGTP